MQLFLAQSSLQNDIYVMESCIYLIAHQFY